MEAIKGLREQIAANFSLMDMCPLDEKFEILIVREAGHYRAAIASKTSRKYLLSVNRVDRTVTAALGFLLDVTAEYINNKENTFYHDSAPYTSNRRTHGHISRPSVSPSSSSSGYSSSGSSVPERAAFIKRESLESSSSGSSSSESTASERVDFDKVEDSESSLPDESQSGQPLQRPEGRPPTPPSHGPESGAPTPLQGSESRSPTPLQVPEGGVPIIHSHLLQELNLSNDLLPRWMMLTRTTQLNLTPYAGVQG